MSDGNGMPKGWAEASLAELCRINPKLDRQLDRPISDDDIVNFVPMAAVDEEFGGVQRPQQKPYRKVKKGYTPFQGGDVIMAKITPCMENGKGGIAEGAANVFYFGSTEFHVFRPLLGISASWIASYLSQQWLRRTARLNMKGSAGQLRVPVQFLEQLAIPVAPGAEQERIVDRIDELFTDLAAGGASLERVQNKLKRYRAAVLHAAVTGKLTENWRKESGPAEETGEQLLERLLVERRRLWEEKTLASYEQKGKKPPKNWKHRYKEPVEPKTNDLPELPEGWCWASMDQIADLTGGVAKNAKSEGLQSMREVLYLRVANVQRGYLDLKTMKSISAKEKDIAGLTLQENDILFTEGGDRDKLGRGWIWRNEFDECIHQNHVFRARLFNDEIQAELVSHVGNGFGQQWFWDNGKQSVNLASISLGVLRQFPIPVAPVKEQVATLDAISEKLSQIDAMEGEVKQGIACAARLRQAILKSAFAGELVPQDPSDEPASVLLDRIRAELEAKETEKKVHKKSRKKKASKKVIRKKTTISNGRKKKKVPKA